jgi:hypothetical protein
MSKLRSERKPYLEIALTVAVLVFLAAVIAGAFNQPADHAAPVALHSD